MMLVGTEDTLLFCQKNYDRFGVFIFFKTKTYQEFSNFVGQNVQWNNNKSIFPNFIKLS